MIHILLAFLLMKAIISRSLYSNNIRLYLSHPLDLAHICMASKVFTKQKLSKYLDQKVSTISFNSICSLCYACACARATTRPPVFSTVPSIYPSFNFSFARSCPRHLNAFIKFSTIAAWYFLLFSILSLF